VLSKKATRAIRVCRKTASTASHHGQPRSATFSTSRTTRSLTAVGKMRRPSWPRSCSTSPTAGTAENFDKRSWECIDEHIRMPRTLDHQGRERLHLTRGDRLHDEIGGVAEFSSMPNGLYTRERSADLLEKTGFRKIRHPQRPTPTPFGPDPTLGRMRGAFS